MTQYHNSAANTTAMVSAALAFISAGVSIIPIDHTTKRPAMNLLPKGEDGKPTWKPFQTQIADEGTVRGWFASGIQAFAVVGGAVSGGLLVLDFDVPGFYEACVRGVGDLVAGLPRQKTGGGGHQVFVRCPYPGRNSPLAWAVDEKEDSGRTIAIETRAEGGYAVVAPSLHPSGNQYVALPGRALSDIPSIDQARVDALLEVARKLDAAPHTRQELERLEADAYAAHRRCRASRNGQASVIDAFNAAHSIEDLLCQHNYTKGTGGRYIRPGGESESVSVREGRSCHWSTDDPLNDGRVVSGCGIHDAFDLFAHFQHGGDVGRAVKDAAELLGIHGEPTRKSTTGPVSAPALIEPYKPFPVAALPGVVARFVGEGAKALGCDPAYVALPLLAVLASAIGTGRRIRLKGTWAEPPVIWAVVVGDSGTLKSPAFDLALRPIRERQKRMMKDYQRNNAAYLSAKEEYDDALKAWRKAEPGDRGDRPVEPEAPICKRLLCSDLTVEALADRLSNAPRGLLVGRDEVSGWLTSFNEYKGGKGGDVSHWLEMHRAAEMIVDRKSSDKPTIIVPRASVCIAGGIQPEILRHCLTQEFYASGLAARLLLAMPPKRRKRWTEAEVDGDTLIALSDLFERLHSLQPSKDIDGDAEPEDVHLTDSAKESWVNFYNEHAQEEEELTGDLSAAWSKLEGYAARLALGVHCIREVLGDAAPGLCDELSMASGIAMAKWFGYEAKRVYAMLSQGEHDRKRLTLVELLKARGGQATVRELLRSSRLYTKAREWEAALNELVDTGEGRWQNPKPGPAGGHPSKVFHLLSQHTSGEIVAPLTVDGTSEPVLTGQGSVNSQRGSGEPTAMPADTAKGSQVEFRAPKPKVRHYPNQRARYDKLPYQPPPDAPSR